MRQRLRAMFSRGADATLAVVLVLAFFLVFMVILWYSFPKGVGLGSAIRSLAPGETSAQPKAVSREEARWEKKIARLTGVKRSVKSKLASSVVWSAAAEGLELAEKDAVQTFSQSSASISFASNQEISLGENSLVVIRRFERDTVSEERRVSVVLLGGALSGSIGTAARGGGFIEIVAGKASASIAQQGGGVTKFRIAAATDDASSISVLSGRAEVQIGERAVSVGSGQTVNVSPKGVVVGPRSIAKAPVLVTPENGAVFRSRVLPKDVLLAWVNDPDARGYRIEMAHDASFRDPVVDRRVNGSSLNFPDLPAGRYYWRLRATDGLSEGRIATARTFEIGTDIEPPPLRVVFPEGPLAGGPVTIRGETEPGAKVYIGKAPAAVGPSGAFEGSVVLRRGAQIVVIEAIDAAGNIAYASRTLAAR